MRRSVTASLARPLGHFVSAVVLTFLVPAFAAAQTPVANQADLAAALTNPAVISIVFTDDITLTANLPQISRSITIDGGGFALSGNNQFRGLVVSGTTTNVTIQNLTIQNTLL